MVHPTCPTGVSFHSCFCRTRSLLLLDRKRLLTVSVNGSVCVHVEKCPARTPRVELDCLSIFSAGLFDRCSLSQISLSSIVENPNSKSPFRPLPPEKADRRNVVGKTIFAKTRANSNLHGVVIGVRLASAPARRAWVLCD